MAGVNKQTNPKIRKANQKFEKQNKDVRKHGKSKVKKSNQADKPALSKFWIYLLAFLIVGGGLLEILALLF
ncbi:hypothetical protein FOG51_00044 [Hanseniaspora uvarum]|uniref:Stress-associated endoplasmic reticulum protein n=1 Tax=Hanseniaspora uvarum TaxID=29833 RepID=A0A1E5RJG8_HANUV|nr:hypothetical protein FOG48_01679 [Hanseniaspora uvarum]KAF0274866.1 hypothetical protein FOG51_00044 [Hanseniaspora uvarum]KAF0277005.1 hypothetical protein FOG50_02061 [Hanseniaspora uvarum]OEJ87025.1 hypothetical protein AWRI3580_g3081 [Hanseniaspora uvarum]GMM39781.1 Ysy6 protein [Hanseniaspora uvarum]